MEALDLTKKPDILEELKNNPVMPNYLKIQHYKDYLLSQHNMNYADAILDFIAREKLGLQRTQEELNEIKKSFEERMEIIKEQDKIGETQCKKIDEENKIFYNSI